MATKVRLASIERFADPAKGISGSAGLQAALETYWAALKAHAATVGQPAPVADSLVERIGLSDGIFEIVSDITRAAFDADGSIVAVIDGETRRVPNDPADAWRVEITKWESAGGVIAPYEAPPIKRQIAKSTIIARLTDEQLNAALAVMTTRQKERWRAPDHPAVDVDDPELLAVLAATGADAAMVLAP